MQLARGVSAVVVSQQQRQLPRPSLIVVGAGHVVTATDRWSASCHAQLTPWLQRRGKSDRASEEVRDHHRLNAVTHRVVLHYAVFVYLFWILVVVLVDRASSLFLSLSFPRVRLTACVGCR